MIVMILGRIEPRGDYMKKIISVLLLICMIFVSVPAFAARLNQNSGSAITTKTKQNSNNKELNDQKVALEQQMEQNKQKLNDLKNQCNKLINAARTRIKKILNQKNIFKKLTKVQTDLLADAVKSLAQYKEELDNENTDMSSEMLNLKDARAQKNTQLIIDTLNKIIGLQLSRIDQLEKIIDGMNKIANMINEIVNI